MKNWQVAAICATVTFAAVGGFYKLGWEMHETLHPSIVVKTSTAEPPASIPVQEEGVLKYDETYVWGDFQLATTVAKPKPVKVANPAGRKYQDFVEYTVTIKNESKDRWTQVHLPLLFDGGGERYSGEEPRELAAGKSVTVKLVYGVPAPMTTEAKIEIAPGFAAPITWK